MIPSGEEIRNWNSMKHKNLDDEMAERIIIGGTFITLAIGLIIYFMATQGEFTSRIEEAQKIEAAALRDCSVSLNVEPETVPNYDIAYWATGYESAKGELSRIECVISSSEWVCTC